MHGATGIATGPNATGLTVSIVTIFMFLGETEVLVTTPITIVAGES